MWGVCDREIGVIREAHQGGEEGVGCVGRVILLDGEGARERHEEVQEGAFCSSLGDPAAWLQEGSEACSSADRVFADVAGGDVVEGEAQAFPYCLQKEPGGVREGSFDVEGGNDEVHRVHVGDGVLGEEIASCGDWPAMAPQRLAGMWGSRWGQMRRRRMVQTILTSVTAQTMGRQLSGLAQSPFL